MELLKVILFAIVICFIVVILKQIKPEYSMIVLVIGGIFLLLSIINSLSSVYGFLSSIITTTGLDSGLFKLLIKIIAIGYVVEFAGGICVDSGNSSIADKILLAGKIMIFLISLPIIKNMFGLIMDFIK